MANSEELKIQILIPTYNRSNDLLKNLCLLKQQIFQDQLEEKLAILISDNCSTDGTDKDVAAFCKANPKLQISYHRQKENIGLEANAVSALSYATAIWVLWLGDDDFLADEYLKFCVHSIERDHTLACIIPGLQSIKKGGELVLGRVENFDTKQIESGFSAVYEYSHLAHQMSGLVVKRAGLLDAYLQRTEYRNPYLFIFFVACSMLKGPSIYAPYYKTSVNTFNEKAWSYNEVGLLDEVYKSYYALSPYLTANKIADLMVRFTVMHSYRLSFQVMQPLQVYGQYQQLRRKAKPVNSFQAKLGFFFVKEYLKACLHAIKG